VLTFVSKQLPPNDRGILTHVKRYTRDLLSKMLKRDQMPGYKEVSIISGTGDVICAAVVVARCNGI
jgi:hypothetical protein